MGPFLFSALFAVILFSIIALFFYDLKTEIRRMKEK